jgi:hypothetical protein
MIELATYALAPNNYAIFQISPAGVILTWISLTTVPGTSVGITLDVDETAIYMLQYRAYFTMNGTFATNLEYC